MENYGQTVGVINISFENEMLFYNIPIVDGSFQKGYNNITKVNGTIIISN